MPEIHILPKEVYQLIAAGEVVERPASIVKEMIENAVDAGAKHITVEIKNGGTTYIRVTDDGCGIAAADIRKVFVSHATSKIKTGEDLNAIATLGFRGEAMASIAAVAHVELLSREKDAPTGIRYEIAGGEETDCAEAGCPKGTTVVVRDIFFNTPARMKFLKKDVTEGNAVAGVVERMAISHPEIAFRFIREGKQTLMTAGNGDLKSTVYEVFGREFAASLIEVDYTVHHMRVSGVITKPSAARKSRAMQFFFINARLVQCRTAMAALEQAYKNTLMVGKFPGCILNIECDASFVDVNVHPAKIEVRFANERPVFELVYYGVKSAIETGDTPKEMQLEEKKPLRTTSSGKLDFLVKETPQQITFPKKTDPQEFWHVAAPAPQYDEDKVEKETQSALPEPFKPAEAAAPAAEEIPPVAQAEPDTLDAEGNEVPDFSIVGEAFKTYIIVEIDNAVYFIDKHAAHERINYEQLKNSTEIHAQMLLTPVTVRLSHEEYSAVCTHLDLYTQCGFIVEDFGNSSVIVRACPALLNGEDVEDLITETAQKLLEGKTDITPEQMDWIFHSTACRSAVKAGDATSREEQQLFIKKLLSMPHIRYCPHGRPVMIKMSRYDIEKQFGRA